jgi:hypothetical protein
MLTKSEFGDSTAPASLAAAIPLHRLSSKIALAAEMDVHLEILRSSSR